MRTTNTSSATPEATPRRARIWHAALLGLGLLIALGTGGWWWSGSEGSLATGLRVASALLPAGTALDSRGVQGSLRHGGRIATLQWRQDGLSLELQALDVQMDAARLLHGRLPLQRIHLGRVEGHSTESRQSAPPMTELLWPVSVDLAWQIDSLRWYTTTPVEATGLQGTYRFDGQHHALQLDQMQWAQGRYRGQLRLQARAPMPVEAQLQGELKLPSGPTPTLQASASLQGTLSGQRARLALQARLSAADNRRPPQLQLEGQLHPHAAQPLSELQAQLQQIDLALLWPGAPQTQLDGQVQARPEAQGWRLEVDLRNHSTGSWDRGRIPLEQLHTRLLHSDAGWRVQTLQARWPGGGAQGQGAWQASGWQGTWQIDHLQPGQWLSALQGPALNGQVTARQNGTDRLDLAVQLQAAQRDITAPAGISAEVRWQQHTWTLSRLALHWADAHLQAQGRWTPADGQVQAQVQWQLPGLTGRLDGQASPRQGLGQWQMEGQDTARLWAWLQRWPVLRESLQGWPAPATLQASGQWQGGWTAEGMQLQARLKSSRLKLQTQARLSQSSASGLWRGQIRQLQLDGPDSPDRSAPERLVLQSPLDWQWQPATGRLQWQAHQWVLQGADHAAPLNIENGHWQMAGRTAVRPFGQGRVQASIAEWPLQWARWPGGRVPAGDLLLQGSVELRLDEARPRLLARLERSRGDLQVGTDQPQQPRIQAGVRTARAVLLVEGAQASLDLAWDSAQAGQLEARLQSRMDMDASEGLAGWWPANAPLSGQVHARLPRVGTWAWLAPPGWRVQGSLDAHVELAGTRAQPRWTGTLQADNLAVRSAVEGIEFGRGRLRARLQEQQMLLEEFRLYGAGAQGGEVSAQGLVRWLPQADTALQAVQMDLQMQAKGLRVSNRADRRLSISGQVRALLERGQMQLRGQMQADSALFILPDNSTPTLGKDVVIVQAQARTPAPAAPPGLSVIGTPDIQVLLQLGPDFQLRGQGLSTRLSGEVQLGSSAATAGQPRLVGQVRTEGGQYKAWGQQLNIDQGLLRFVGPWDNPALDILALRPNLGQSVGVRVSGTAQAPRVRLYADPDMPDADKLAWLVLGRSPAAGGAESAVLQQAALALLGSNGKSLGGELAGTLGFDEVSLASRSSTTASGSTATGTALMLGKRLSKDFYLAYESSVSGTFGSLFIFYDLSRKLSLRAQTGEINALDLIWSIRHD